MSTMITAAASSETGFGLISEIIQTYTLHLQAQGYSPKRAGKCIRTIRHLFTWLSANGTGIEALDIRLLQQFMRHDCACPGPHGYRKNRKRCAGHLHRFLGFLIETGRVRIPAEIEAGSRIVEAFLQSLAAQGYVPDSISAYRKRCRHLVVWLYLNDIALAGIDDSVVYRFLSHDCACAHPLFFSRGTRFVGGQNSKHRIRVFLNYLIDAGIAPPRLMPASEEAEKHLPRFATWLQRRCDISEKTMQSYLKAIRVLLLHLGDDPDQYNATLIKKAVQHRLGTASRELVRRETSALRQYLRFLALDGICRPGLVAAVPKIPRKRFSTLPRHLPQDTIELIIAACDCATLKGLRDRAILLLLARLALRAGDVANLQLNDINWNTGLIRVSGKSRRDTVLPLPQDVGGAIRDYILHARPAVESGPVFLRTMPPLHDPFPAVVCRQSPKLQSSDPASMRQGCRQRICSGIQRQRICCATALRWKSSAPFCVTGR